MALVVPNLDRIQKEYPKLGEALLKLQTYTNQNVTPAAGNRLPTPPFNPAGTT